MVNRTYLLMQKAQVLFPAPVLGHFLTPAPGGSVSASEGTSTYMHIHFTHIYTEFKIMKRKISKWKVKDARDAISVVKCLFSVCEALKSIPRTVPLLSPQNQDLKYRRIRWQKTDWAVAHVKNVWEVGSLASHECTNLAMFSQKLLMHCGCWKHL